MRLFRLPGLPVPGQICFGRSTQILWMYADMKTNTHLSSTAGPKAEKKGVKMRNWFP